MTRRYHSSVAVATTIPGGTTNVATSIVIAAATGLPASYPYTMVIDDDTTTMEAVEVTNRSGTTLTVTRGVDGTTAQSHSAGATIHHGWSARDLDEPNAWINAGHNHSTTALGGAVPQSSVTSLVSDLAAKAALASPAFTGTPTLNGGPLAGGLVFLASASPAAVSSVSINSCFSSLYETYMVLGWVVGSTVLDVQCRLRVSGVDNSAGSYQHAQSLGNLSYAGSETTTDTKFLPISNIGSSGTIPLEMLLMRPFAVANTGFLSRGWRSADNYAAMSAGQHGTATSFDGFSLLASTGTITGTIRVYGVQNT